MVIFCIGWICVIWSIFKILWKRVRMVIWFIIFVLMWIVFCLYFFVLVNIWIVIKIIILFIGGGFEWKLFVFILKGSVVVYSVYILYCWLDLYGMDVEVFCFEWWDEDMFLNWDLIL